MVHEESIDVVPNSIAIPFRIGHYISELVQTSPMSEVELILIVRSYE